MGYWKPISMKKVMISYDFPCVALPRHNVSPKGENIHKPRVRARTIIYYNYGLYSSTVYTVVLSVLYVLVCRNKMDLDDLPFIGRYSSLYRMAQGFFVSHTIFRFRPQQNVVPK